MEYCKQLVINVVKIKASSEESYFFKGLLISSSTYAFMDSGFIILNKTLLNWALEWICNQTTLALRLIFRQHIYSIGEWYTYSITYCKQSSYCLTYLCNLGASLNRLKLIINFWRMKWPFDKGACLNVNLANFIFNQKDTSMHDWLDLSSNDSSFFCKE